ncbi:MAG: YdcF family protein [Pseudomonadota bacterium]|nr:YdcF family protein [Pseudomonadota bacterium]
MFFKLSKILWALTSPISLMLLALTLAVVLTLVSGPRGTLGITGRTLLVATLAALLLVPLLGLGSRALAMLENRFPAIGADKIGPVAGIVCLGGALDLNVRDGYGRAGVGGAAERLMVFAELGNRYPDARMIYSGGAGSMRLPTIREADRAKDWLAVIGFDTDRAIFERESRNTHDNAINSLALAAPKPGETWLLVTSAWHMPRSVGIFRTAGFPVIPWPVDRRTGRSASLWTDFDPLREWMFLTIAAHELYGLMAYRLIGRIDNVFPAP